MAELLARRLFGFACAFALYTSFPEKSWADIIKNFEHVLIPEINNGQLIKIIRDQYLVDAKGYNKIMGIPFTKHELIDEIKKLL